MQKHITFYPVAVSLLCLSLCLTGCAATTKVVKKALGASTEELEKGRKNAAILIFNYDYDACYAKVEKIINAHRELTVYDNDPAKGMIAVYYVDINTTPIGVFFSKIDASHTRVEVSSRSTNAKMFMVNKVLLGKDKR